MNHLRDAERSFKETFLRNLCYNKKRIEVNMIELSTLLELRKEKQAEKEKMETLVEDIRVKLHPTDNGKLFRTLVEEMSNDTFIF